MRFLLDTNILIPLENSQVVLEESLAHFVRLANEHGHQLVYHPASEDDISSQKIGGGITRQQLLDYLDGKQTAFALELSKVNMFGEGILPSIVFGRGFRAPQSFRYLRQNEEAKLNQLIGK